MNASNDVPSQVTALLTRADMTDSEKQDQLLNLIYAELRKMAQNKMRSERQDHTLSATALVHEAYLRLVKQPDLSWQSKRHFFAAVAESMRRILIESARAKASLKRGANATHVRDIDIATTASLGGEMLALDHALSQLERKDEVMSDVVKLRYFSGLTVEQTALAMDISPRTVNRTWTAARAWLLSQMQ